MIFHAPQIVCFQTLTVQHFNMTINTLYFMLPLLYPHAAMTPGSPGSAFLVHTKISTYADNSKFFIEVNSVDDCTLLQEDLVRVFNIAIFEF